MLTDGTPCLYTVQKDSSKGFLMVAKLGAKTSPFKPVGVGVRPATTEEIEMYKEKQLTGKW